VGAGVASDDDLGKTGIRHELLKCFGSQVYAAIRNQELQVCGQKNT
jgi:hypothetical protein